MSRILVAPDKFKGSLSASEVARSVARGILASRPVAEVRAVPVADGGEGTLDAAIAAGYTTVPVVASGPTGLHVETCYARSGETAVVEMADVSGLGRLPQGVRQPLAATSFGLGEVMSAAITDGCRRLVVGVGGSACTDGGAGMLQALGVRLLDEDGQDLPPGGAALARLCTLDLASLRDLDGIEIVIASDVDNPLTGDHGAAAVYGPQKGARPEDVRLLESALTRWADIVSSAAGNDYRGVPGAGAAGGVGFAAMGLLGATLWPGIDLILDILDFDAHLDGVDWVVVGEGSIDKQTLHGKAPMGVAVRARAAGARVLAICGRRLVGPEELRHAGIEMVHSLAEAESDPALSMANASKLLESLAKRLAAGGLFD